jgi:hypothetical protein
MAKKVETKKVVSKKVVPVKKPITKSTGVKKVVKPIKTVEIIDRLNTLEKSIDATIDLYDKFLAEQGSSTMLIEKVVGNLETKIKSLSEKLKNS